MPIWFASTLFASAFLLFAVQPLAAKLLLPIYGGTAAVWNTCLLFFQLLLLGGYLYAHLLGQRLDLRRQLVFHSALAVLAFLIAPLLFLMSGLATRWTPQGAANPIGSLLAVLLATVGVPFFVLSATAPLLQRWFERSGHPGGRDPYHLYVASNLGSMLALLSYPFVWEPHFALGAQAVTWVCGYGVFAAMIVASAVLAASVAGAERSETPERDRSFAALSPGHTAEFPPHSDLLHCLRWLALAFVPASLLYGVTTYLTTDVAAVPLLWIVPLAVYLLTFILMFAPLPAFKQATLRQVFPAAVLAQTFFFSLQDVRPVWVLLALHLLVFFVVALTCHGELARSRPPAIHLTEFYLWLSLGGVFAGVFNALLAPRIFGGPVEYPLVLIASCLIVPMGTWEQRPKLAWPDIWLPLGLFVVMACCVPIVRTHVDDPMLLATLLYGLPAAVCYAFVNHPLRFTLGVMALVGAGTLGVADRGNRLVDHSRNFFGTLNVVDVKDKADSSVVFRRFLHGTTLHGVQRLGEGYERTALSYYFHNGAIGQLFEAFAQSQPGRRVAVLGLGAGTLACYAEAGQSWTFFEIDPEVARIARQHFSFLRDAENRGAPVELVLGDARLALREFPDESFDWIFADAFSSDAVPVHLLTREAADLYLRKLRAHGILVFNVTNRCLDLEPVLARLSEELALAGRIREELPQEISAEEKRQGKTPSRWLVMARSDGDLGKLVADTRWRPLRTRPNVGAWTDSYSNVFRVFRWLPRERGHREAGD